MSTTETIAHRRNAMLASTEWLAAHLDDPSIRVVDCRFYFDDVGRGRRVYEEAHIPGAVYLDWSTDISQPRGDLKYMAPSADQLKAAMERLGIGDDTTVVGYDDEGGHYVARLWLVLRRFGHGNLRLLEGGWTAWVDEGRPTRWGAEQAPRTATFTIDPARERPEVFVTAEEVLARTGQPGTTLLDVRRWSEYTGEEVRSRRGGRIPGAAWLLWQDNLRWDGDRGFKPDAEIRQRYEAAGVTPDTRIVAYCHGAVRAGHTAFTLAMLGYQDVQVYDGSWEEWGSRDDLPIATGEPTPTEASGA